MLIFLSLSFLAHRFNIFYCFFLYLNPYSYLSICIAVYLSVCFSFYLYFYSISIYPPSILFMTLFPFLCFLFTLSSLISQEFYVFFFSLFSITLSFLLYIYFSIAFVCHSISPIVFLFFSFSFCITTIPSFSLHLSLSLSFFCSLYLSLLILPFSLTQFLAFILKSLSPYYAIFNFSLPAIHSCMLSSKYIYVFYPFLYVISAVHYVYYVSSVMNSLVSYFKHVI